MFVSFYFVADVNKNPPLWAHIWPNDWVVRRCYLLLFSNASESKVFLKNTIKCHIKQVFGLKTLNSISRQPKDFVNLLHFYAKNWNFEKQKALRVCLWASALFSSTTITYCYTSHGIITCTALRVNHNFCLALVQSQQSFFFHKTKTSAPLKPIVSALWKNLKKTKTYC